jgi:hypothetical protein
MRVLVALALLSAGIWAAITNLAPARFASDMSPLTGEESRVAGFAGVRDNTASVAPFETTVAAVESPVTPAQKSEPDSWARGTTLSTSSIDVETRTSLARDIQAELARLGCYSGPVNGDWSADTQRAAGLFATEANARIPLDQPDFALFSLAKAANGDQACGPAIVAATTPPPVAPMGLGGPDTQKREKTVSYHRDRNVEQLFTNPLGR